MFGRVSAALVVPAAARGRQASRVAAMAGEDISSPGSPGAIVSCQLTVSDSIAVRVVAAGLGRAGPIGVILSGCPRGTRTAGKGRGGRVNRPPARSPPVPRVAGVLPPLRIVPVLVDAEACQEARRRPPGRSGSGWRLLGQPLRGDSCPPRPPPPCAASEEVDATDSIATGSCDTSTLDVNRSLPAATATSRGGRTGAARRRRASSR